MQLAAKQMTNGFSLMITQDTISLYLTEVHYYHFIGMLFIYLLFLLKILLRDINIFSQQTIEI